MEKKKDAMKRRVDKEDDSSQASVTKEIRSKDKYRKRETKLMYKIKRLQKKVKKTKKDDDRSIS